MTHLPIPLVTPECDLRSRRKRRVVAARLLGRHTTKEWLDLLDKFRNCCVYCGTSGGYPSKLTKDHILPVSAGGSDAIENIQPLCRRCNSTKGVRGVDWRNRAA